MGFFYNDISATFAAEDRTKNNLLGLLAYFPFLFIVSYLLANRSPVIRFHANQGFAITVIMLVASLIGRFTYVLAFLLALPLSLISLVAFIMAVYAAYNAYKGVVIEYPLISFLKIFK